MKSNQDRSKVYFSGKKWNIWIGWLCWKFFLMMKRRWFLLISKSLHMSMNESAERPKILRELKGRLKKFSKRKLRVQCLQKLLVFISSPLCIDIQVGFKTYCQFEYKKLFICCDKKIVIIIIIILMHSVNVGY